MQLNELMNVNIPIWNKGDVRINYIYIIDFAFTLPRRLVDSESTTSCERCLLLHIQLSVYGSCCK